MFLRDVMFTFLTETLKKRVSFHLFLYNNDNSKNKDPKTWKKLSVFLFLSTSPKEPKVTLRLELTSPEVRFSTLLINYIYLSDGPFSSSVIIHFNHGIIMDLLRDFK